MEQKLLNVLKELEFIKKRLKKANIQKVKKRAMRDFSKKKIKKVKIKRRILLKIDE